MKRIEFFLAFLMVVLTSCNFSIDLFPEKQNLENGIFAGVVYDRLPSAYRVINNEVIPLGTSAKLEEVVVIDGISFTAVPENKSFSSFMCRKVNISTADYKPADNKEIKGFGGLWLSVNEKNNSYDNGLVMAIKPMNDHWEITFADLNGYYSKVKAESAMVNGHQELTFHPSSDMTDGEDEVWVLTASSMAGYDFKSNILNLKTSNSNQEYFQFIAIHNVL
jgi:hypothetical protein